MILSCMLWVSTLSPDQPNARSMESADQLRPMEFLQQIYSYESEGEDWMESQQSPSQLAPPAMPKASVPLVVCRTLAQS